jgi:hypothetical protein
LLSICCRSCWFSFCRDCTSASSSCTCAIQRGIAQLVLQQTSAMQDSGLPVHLGLPCNPSAHYQPLACMTWSWSGRRCKHVDCMECTNLSSIKAPATSETPLNLSLFAVTLSRTPDMASGLLLTKWWAWALFVWVD